MPEREVVARLEGVAAGYAGRGDGRPVLSRVDLDLRAGQQVALLGANGSGKTTLLRVLTGALRPTAGRVEVFGRPIGSWDRTDLARRMTVLPQDLELPHGFRVSEVVALGRIPHARSWFADSAEDQAAVARALVDADVAELAGRGIDELSGGERQRVGVALALAQEPQLLLLGEPTVHLDLAHQVSLMQLLEHLTHSRGLSVLMVVHDLNLAARFADRSLVLHEGRLLAAGDARGRFDLRRLRDAFGVPIAEGVTRDGRRVLVPVLPVATIPRIPD